MLEIILKILKYVYAPLWGVNYGIHIIASTIRYIEGVIKKKYSIKDISKFAFVALLFNIFTGLNLKHLYNSIFKPKEFIKHIDFDLNFFVNDELLTEEDKEYLKNIDNTNCSNLSMPKDPNNYFSEIRPINRDLGEKPIPKKRIK